MIVTGELDLEQFTPAEGQGVELDVFSYFVENGYPVDEILEAHSVVNQKPDDENSGHIVLKVKTLSKPLSEADAVEDEMHMWTCDCKGYQYHYSVDLSERRLGEWDFCPHIEAVAKSVKALNDDSQTELME